MLYKTLEEKMLAEFELLSEKFQQAMNRIHELEDQLAGDKQTIAEEPVFIRTISKEVCRLTVYNDYYMRGNEKFDSLSIEEIKEILSNEEKIKEYANLPYDNNSWSHVPFVNISTHIFPYTATILGRCILIDAYENSDKNMNTSIRALRTGELSEGHYFDTSRKDEMYEYGLTKFKNHLQDYYQYRLKKEGQ